MNLFQLITKIIPDLREIGYARYDVTGLQPLSIDVLYNTGVVVRFAMAHNSIQNGDVMADPDMEIIIDFEKQTVIPQTFQNDYLGVYHSVDNLDIQSAQRLIISLKEQLVVWLQSIEKLGYNRIDQRMAT